MIIIGIILPRNSRKKCYDSHYCTWIELCFIQCFDIFIRNLVDDYVEKEGSKIYVNIIVFYVIYKDASKLTNNILHFLRNLYKLKKLNNTILIKNLAKIQKSEKNMQNT